MESTLGAFEALRGRDVTHRWRRRVCMEFAIEVLRGLYLTVLQKKQGLSSIHRGS